MSLYKVEYNIRLTVLVSSNSQKDAELAPFQYPEFLEEIAKSMITKTTKISTLEQAKQAGFEETYAVYGEDKSVKEIFDCDSICHY